MAVVCQPNTHPSLRATNLLPDSAVTVFFFKSFWYSIDRPLPDRGNSIASCLVLYVKMGIDLKHCCTMKECGE